MSETNTHIGVFYFPNSGLIKEWVTSGRMIGGLSALTHVFHSDRISIESVSPEYVDEFAQRPPSRFWLHGDIAVVDCEFEPKWIRVSIDVSNNGSAFCDHADIIMQEALRNSADFGCLCSIGEFEHRHLLRTPLGFEWSATSLVGRDISKYFPGLYWKTAFSREYLMSARPVLDKVLSLVPTAKLYESDYGSWITLYSQPERWCGPADLIDDCLFQSKEWFSIRRLERASGETPAARSESHGAIWAKWK